MTPFTENPFAVLTTVVAPAVLTNACSVLCLGTSNRVARVVDRSRVVAGELGRLGPGSDERESWEDQLEVLRARAHSLLWSLRVFYAALASFALAALTALIGSASASLDQQWLFRVAAGIGLAAGLVGVTGLALGCALMVNEVRLAIKQIGKEAESDLPRRGESQPTQA